MSADYTPIPPAGYRYHADLFADWSDSTPVHWLAWANLLALVPLGAGVLIVWLPYQLYLFLGAPLAAWPDLSLSMLVTLIVGLGIVLASMLLHETLHGLALKLSGYHPILSFSEGFLWAGLRKGLFLTRSHYLIMCLAPAVSMTLLGGLSLLVLPPAIGRLLVIALLLNLAASVGDLLVAARVRRCPPDALFADDHGIRVFLPLAASSPEPLAELTV